MRHSRLAPALISALLLQATFASIVRAQTASDPPAPSPPAAGSEVEGDDGAEEAPMDDAEPAPSDPKPAAPADEEETAADEEVPSDDELEAEMAKELAAEDAEGAAALTRPPAKGKGAVVGVVKDAVEHETTPEAQITVVGTKYKAIADFDGRYRLELPPGTYTLRIYVELHKPSVIKGVEVKADVLDRFDIEVVPDEEAVDTVEIVTEVDKSTTEGLLLTRQRSAVVGDGIGRAEISRTPASNAAQATQRVVGATIVGNRFVYVRGLGERYTNALLNGVPLPSPEPDRAAVPLDLFPSLILESVTIAKTFTPDVPADFAGGSVRILTRELPSKPLLQLSLGAGFDTNTTFRDRLSHPGSSTDFLGYDGGTRSLPDGFPDYVLKPGDAKPGGGEITDDDLFKWGREINSSMHPRNTFSLPNYSFSAVGGRGWDLGGEQRLGALASLNYGRSFKRTRKKLATFGPSTAAGTDGQEISVIAKETDLTADVGEDKVSWGTLGSISYWPSRNHRLTLLGIHTQLADATTQLVRGFFEESQSDIATGRLRYVSRALNVLQLRGEHDFKALNSARLDWHASYSVALRDEPDTRTTVFQFKPEDSTWNAVNTPENGSHLFATQEEKSKGGGLDWTQPLTTDPEQFKVKLGGLVSSRDRDFAARKLTYVRVRGAMASRFACASTEYRLDCPEPIYQWNNIGDIITPAEITAADDAYKASLDIFAGYLMFDANVTRDVRVVAGARVERTDQDTTPYSQYTDGRASEGGSIENTDLLPALSLTYSATKKTKLRAAVSQTLARPQIRELSPYVFADYFGARPIGGNPKLRMTRITNADLRWELFPSPREVLAFSFFYKLFDDPIEPFITDNGLISYQNAAGARLIGAEVEARKDLAFLTENLKDFSVIANLTLASSQIELNDDQRTNATNKERPMVFQAPYVINVMIDYENEPLKLNVRLLGNVSGKTIVEVGTAGIDDAYQQPSPSMDLTVGKGFGSHFNLKLNATNLLNSAVLVTQGKKRNPEYEILRYREGRVFTVTGAYTF